MESVSSWDSADWSAFWAHRQKSRKIKIGKYTKRALIGGAISLTVILAGTFLLRELRGYEAKVLIKNSLDGLNTLCNTIAMASATILALLLTLLSLSSGSKSELSFGHP